MSHIRRLLFCLTVVGQVAQADPIDVGQVVGLTPGIRGAVELVFQTEAGKYYQVEISADLVTWDNEGYSVKGTGGQMSVFAGTRNLANAYYRLSDAGDPANVAPVGPVGPAGPAGDDAEVADFARGQHVLPLTGSKVWHAGRAQYDRPALTVLAYGDSLSYQFGNLAPTDLIEGMPFMGYKLMAHDMCTVISGSIGAPAYGADWLTNQYRLQGASSVTEWARGGNRSNRISVAYLKGTGNSTFTLRYSQNGGASWTTAATIDTTVAANEFNFAIYNLPSSRPTKVRVETASGHAVKLIGCGAWTGEEGNYAGEGGYVVVCGARGGLEVEEALSCASSSTWATIMSAAKVNMVIGSWNDPASHWADAGSIETLRARADAGRVADWIMVSGVGGHLGSDDMVARMQQQRQAMRDWAEREGQNFIDWAGVQRDSFPYAVSLGWHSAIDVIHPTQAGYLARQRFVAKTLGDVLNASAELLGNNRAELGFGFQLRSTPYGVQFESDGSNSGGLTLTGSGNFFALESRTDTDPWKNLTTTYSGSEAAGMTLAMTTNRQQGQPKNIFTWTSTGNSDTTNLHLTSDYPLTMALKRVNSTPTTPPAGHLTPYAFNNGGVMEYRMMPPNGVPVVLGTEGQSRLSGKGTLDFGNIAAGAESTLTITVTGVAATNIPSVELGWSAPLEDGIVVKQAWVSAANMVSVRVRNNSAADIDPAAVTCRATVSGF